MLEHPGDAPLANIPRGDQQVAGGTRRLDVLAARRPDAPQADLDDAGHVVHLGRATHRRRVALAHPVNFVPEVEVGVDLQDRQRSAVRERAEDRDRDGVVTAQADRHRAAVEDGGHGLGDPRAVSRAVIGGTGDVAGIGERARAHGASASKSQ